jgi:quinol monooxygenase YgiN
VTIFRADCASGRVAASFRNNSSTENSLKTEKMEQITLSIRFTASPENKDAFKQALINLFNTINKEKNFVNATLHQGFDKEEEFLVYETWNDTPEHFINVQMKEPYAVEWENYWSAWILNANQRSIVPLQVSEHIWSAKTKNKKIQYGFR